jgi:hypothetical protein
MAMMLAVGCATTATQRYTPRFDYTPPKAAKPAAANITFAVVNATYPDRMPLFDEFSQNMSKDFFEILTARGFTVRGPFRTYDDITFPDKKGSDLILIPELQINPDASNVRWEQSLMSALLPGASKYTGTGTVTITGRVNLVIAESLSREKMWTKSVDIPAVTIPIEETQSYSMPGINVRTLIQNEATIYNGVAQGLEKQYKAILERAYAYLDPDEIQLVKKQAQEIRAKKVY